MCHSDFFCGYYQLCYVGWSGTSCVAMVLPGLLCYLAMSCCEKQVFNYFGIDTTYLADYRLSQYLLMMRSNFHWNEKLKT